MTLRSTRPLPAPPTEKKAPRNSSRFRGPLTDPDAALDITEAAALLNVPPSFLYSETRRKDESRIPFVRLGR